MLRCNHGEMLPVGFMEARQRPREMHPPADLLLEPVLAGGGYCFEWMGDEITDSASKSSIGIQKFQWRLQKCRKSNYADSDGRYQDLSHTSTVGTDDCNNWIVYLADMSY